MGLEPTIPGSEDQCLLHWATGASIDMGIFVSQIYTYVHTHTHMQTYTYTRMHTHAHTNTHTYMHAYIHIHAHMHTHRVKFGDWLVLN